MISVSKSKQYRTLARQVPNIFQVAHGNTILPKSPNRVQNQNNDYSSTNMDSGPNTSRSLRRKQVPTKVTSPSLGLHSTINVMHQNVNHSMVDLPQDSSFNNSNSSLPRLNAKLVKPRQSLAQFNQSRYLGKDFEEIGAQSKMNIPQTARNMPRFKNSISNDKHMRNSLQVWSIH